ncbi:MAG: hypothetical protein PVI26_10425, partial [Chitinispirillia bacterium]
MFYSKTFKKLKVVKNFLTNLTEQPPEKGIIKGQKHKNSVKFEKDRGIVPAITVCDNKTTCKKGDSVSLSCYYNKNQLVIQTKILRVIKNRIVIKKPDEITLIKQRASERYTPAPSDNIQFVIPSIKKTFNLLNIGTHGICIASKENLLNIGSKFFQCMLKTDEKNFFVDCIIRNQLNIKNSHWKYGIELSFPDPLSFYNYLEWIFSLLQQEIYTPSRMF